MQGAGFGVAVAVRHMSLKDIVVLLIRHGEHKSPTNRRRSCARYAAHLIGVYVVPAISHVHDGFVRGERQFAPSENAGAGRRNVWFSRLDDILPIFQGATTFRQSSGSS